MDNKEKILELLSQKQLTEDEKKLLEDALIKQPELQEYQIISNKLNDISSRFHLNNALLSKYVLYLNNIPVEDTNFKILIPQIEKHISTCSDCQKEFENLNEEYSDVDDYLSDQIKSEKHVTSKPAGKKSLFGMFNSVYVNYSFASLIVVIILYFSLFTISELATPSYKKLKDLNELNDFSSNRGRISTHFQNGLAAIKENDYAKAVTIFNEDIKQNPSDETIFYTHYILGLAHLKKSESAFLGLFNSFDQSEIDKAIANFNKAVEKNNSGLFTNITYDLYYFLGKAYLLKDDFENAGSYLNMVIEYKGSYYNDAISLMELIK